jgi:2-iminoacetate synthase
MKPPVLEDKMVDPERETGSLNLPAELYKRKRIILGELKERTLWFVKLRWWVPPFIVAGTLLARGLGVEFRALPLLLIALFILAYNTVFHLLSRRVKTEPHQKEHIQRFTSWQIGFDYGTMFLIIYFTGGLTSPFIFFFIFHITFSAIFLPRGSTYSLAAIAAAGMIVIAGAEYLGWIPHHALSFRGRSIDLSAQPFHMMVILSFFAGFVFITAFSITAVMNMLKKRILDLAELTETVTNLNERLQTLYDVVQAVGSEQHLNQVLQVATSELAKVMDVKAISVKLLSEDGKFLHYAAAHGLPTDFLRDKVVQVARSPLNRRIIEGEPFVSGSVTQREVFQFGEDLQGAGIKSVQFIPLIVKNRTIGILGAYSSYPERFGQEELDFFRLAAGLLAIAIANAQAYEAIENLIEERSRFMNRVAHNLRAPLVAMSSMLEVIRNGYLGDLSETSHQYLHRIDHRVQGMLLMISELMTLAKSQTKHPRLELGLIHLKTLAHRIQQTFQEEVLRKRLTFEVTVPEDLPGVKGDQEMIEEMLENLVSNAIKYTPEGGRVGITFWPGSDETIRIVVSDNGMGIPKQDQRNLFKEFFRASNVQNTVGTGLGLTIVKEIIDKHGGKIEAESEEGLGTTFIVHLPIVQREEGQREGSMEKGKTSSGFINEKEIEQHLEAAARWEVDRVREVIAKAKELKGLDIRDVATLLQCRDPVILEEMFHAAREVKEAIYGNRLVLFAPLYISNLCQNDCQYCAFRASNKKIRRKALSQAEIAEEVRHLVRTGHKRILLVAGEAYPGEGFDYILRSIETIYATRDGKGEIRRVNAEIAPLTVEEFRRLKDAKIGTYVLFQESYHLPTYKKMHLSGPKADYNWRLGAMGRAFEGGIDDVGIGVLFGLYDFRFEVLGLLQHVRHLEKVYGLGPHTISVPRLEPADGSWVASNPPFPVSDEDFKKIVAILRLAVPYTGIIMSTRETAAIRAETFALGVSQISAGSRTNPGGYSNGEPSGAQFQLGDHRSLDEVIFDIVGMRYIPSFCTACYRKGRTGEDFMDLAKPGLIKQFCLPNALLTFQEYLEDYAIPETRTAGLELIEKNIGEIPTADRQLETKDRLVKIEQGKRDLYF